MELTKEQAKERADLTIRYRYADELAKKEIREYLEGKGFELVEGPLGESQSYFLTPEELENWKLANESIKPSFRYNIIFMCIQDWAGEKSEEVGRYESNNPFPDLSKSDTLKIKGKRYGVTKKTVEFDPDDRLVIIYEVFCIDVPLTEGDDEE